MERERGEERGQKGLQQTIRVPTLLEKKVCFSSKFRDNARKIPQDLTRNRVTLGSVGSCLDGRGNGEERSTAREGVGGWGCSTALLAAA